MQAKQRADLHPALVAPDGIVRQAGKVGSIGKDPTEGTTGGGGCGSLIELTHSLSEIARVLCSAGGVTNTLGQVIVLAMHSIEGCDFAGLFVHVGGVALTPVLSDPIVQCVETLEHQAAEGPCLDAITQAHMVYAEDLVSDLRWPLFGPRAAAQGIRSALALPLPRPQATNGTGGVINLYAHCPAAFGEVDRVKGAHLASLASIAVTAAGAIEKEERRIDNLQTALRSREVIGQAQGILMEREHIAANEAFDLLNGASQYLNIKLREVAQILVATGKTPQTGPQNRRRGDARGR